MVDIDRYDKKPALKEIQEDWRTWADLHGYEQVEVFSIEYEDMSVILEVWENLSQEDSYF